MGWLRAVLLHIVVVTTVLAIHTDKEPSLGTSRSKRIYDYDSSLSRSFTAERRVATSSVGNTSKRNSVPSHYFDRGTPPLTVRHHGISNNPFRRQRPHTVPPPPYAVQMEPLVQYSQRDPLYHQQQKELAGLTSEQSFNDLQQTKKSTSTPPLSSDEAHEKSSKSDTENDNPLPKGVYYAPEQQTVQDNEAQAQHHEPYALYGPHFADTPYYIREPEPIIEIIIKESNVTLPPPPTTPTPPPRPPTKEPVHVFYVKYKKDPSKYGKDSVIYDEPIPAVTPASTNSQSSDYQPPAHPLEDPVTQPPTPPLTTTLRTIIRPDSEIYHGSGLHVTFGKPSEDKIDTGLEEQQQQSAPQPAVAVPDPQQQQQQSAPQSVVAFPQQQFPQRPPSFPVYTQQQPEPFHPTPSSQQLPFQHQPPFQRPVQQPPVPQQRPPQFQQPFHQVPQPLFRQLPTQQQQQHHQQHQQHQHQQPKPSFPPQPFLQRQPFQQQPHQRQQVTQFPHQQLPLHPQLPRPSFQQQVHQNTPPRTQFQQPFRPGDQSHFQLNQHQNLQQSFPSQQQRNNVQIQQSIPQPSQQHILQQQQQGHHQQHQSQQHFQHQQVQQQLLQQQQQQLLLQQQQRQQLLLQQQQNQQQQQKLQQQLQQQHQANTEILPFTGEIVKSIPQLEEHQVHTAQSRPTTQQQPDIHTQSQSNRFGQRPVQPQQFQQPLFQQQQKQTPQQQQKQQPLLGNPQQQQKQKHHVQQLQLQQQQQQLLTQHSQLRLHQLQNQQPLTQTQTLQHPNPTVPPPKAPTTKPPRLFSLVPTSTTTPIQVTTPKTNPEKKVENDKTASDQEKKPLPVLPDEVPEDLRQQLLSSGILSNADIQVLDYDKVGDIPIESLPPEALENFYGAGSAPVPSVVTVNGSAPSETPVEMKVVRYDSLSSEGREVAEKYVQQDATQIDPVVLNDSGYNRYLPLKVSGAQFPLPDVPELKGRNVTSVVVLAPVDYEFLQNPDGSDSEREGREAAIEVQGVRFVAGNILKDLVKNPTAENYKRWLEQEKTTAAEKQSIILLVADPLTGEGSSAQEKEIFMYDVATQKVSKLRGELSTAFVEVAEANASSQDIDNLSTSSSEIMELRQRGPLGEGPSAEASEVFEQRVPADKRDLFTAASEIRPYYQEFTDLSAAASENNPLYQDASNEQESDLAVAASEEWPAYHKPSDLIVAESKVNPIYQKVLNERQSDLASSGSEKKPASSEGSDLAIAASEIHPRYERPFEVEDIAAAASELHPVQVPNNAVSISTGYSKTSEFSAATL